MCETGYGKKGLYDHSMDRMPAMQMRPAVRRVPSCSGAGFVGISANCPSALIIFVLIGKHPLQSHFDGSLDNRGHLNVFGMTMKRIESG